MKPASTSSDLKYKQKQELESLKKKLLLKLARDIKNKYSSLLSDKELEVEFFNKEFQNEIEKHFDFNNPDYKKFFLKVEKLVLTKLDKIQDKKRENLIQKNEVEELTSTSLDKKTKFEKINFNYLPEGKLKRTKLREELKRKEKDDWAKLAKYSCSTFQEEQSKEKENEKKLKSLYKEELMTQITMKKETENFLKREERSEIVDIIRQKEEEKQKEEQLKNEKIKQIKLTYEKLNRDNEANRKIKSEILLKNKMEEKRIEEEMKKFNEIEERKVNCNN